MLVKDVHIWLGWRMLILRDLHIFIIGHKNKLM